MNRPFLRQLCIGITYPMPELVKHFTPLGIGGQFLQLLLDNSYLLVQF